MRTALAENTAPDMNLGAEVSTLDASPFVVGAPSAPLARSGAALNDNISANAVAARRAGRLSAAKISEDEVQALLAERSKLVDKKLDGTITKKEANRLEYVRWSLDRVEDARYGESLDRLEELILMQERMASEVQSLTSELRRFDSRK